MPRKNFPNDGKHLRIRMHGKQGKTDYYFVKTGMPVMVDLTNCAIHFFPDESSDGQSFGGDLVIRTYKPGEAVSGDDDDN